MPDSLPSSRTLARARALHGFPTCSYDWRALIALEPERAILGRDHTFERVCHASRWHGAIRDWPKSLSPVWGLLAFGATLAQAQAAR